MRATRAIIHLYQFRKNIQAIAEVLPKETKICIPIKANAYGHGAVHCAIAAIQAGAQFLAVASVQEGVELRRAGIVTPVLLFSLPLPEEIAEIIEYGLTPLVEAQDFVDLFAQAAKAEGKRCPVHLKIDTGMARVGCPPEKAVELARAICQTDSLFLEGTATHLASADSLDPEDIAWTRTQIARFNSALDSLKNAGIDPGIRHMANSGAIILHPEAIFDMVRPGLLAYGYQPILDWPENRQAKSPSVRAVMEVDTHIVSVREVAKGEPISYGRKWIAPRNTRIATLPIGYADGLPRALSGHFSAIIRGKAWPQVGLICMDQCMLDIGPKTDAPDSPARWDRAIIFGPDAPAADARNLAEKIGSIPYELCCGIHRRVPRIYLNAPEEQAQLS